MDSGDESDAAAAKGGRNGRGGKKRAGGAAAAGGAGTGLAAGSSAVTASDSDEESSLANRKPAAGGRGAAGAAGVAASTGLAGGKKGGAAAAAGSDSEDGGSLANRGKTLTTGKGAAGGAAAAASSAGKDDSDVEKPSRGGGGLAAAAAGGKPKKGVTIAAADSDEEAEEAKKAAAAAAAAASAAAAAGSGKKSVGFRPPPPEEEEEEAAPLPKIPEGPTMEGWVQKPAQLRMSSWQNRFLLLKDGFLYVYDTDPYGEDGNGLQDTDHVTIDVTTITDVKGNPRSAVPSQRKTFTVHTESDVLTFRVPVKSSPEQVAMAWVNSVQAAIAHAKKFASAKADLRAKMLARRKSMRPAKGMGFGSAAAAAAAATAAAAAASKKGGRGGDSDDEDGGGAGGRGKLAATAEGDSDADSDAEEGSEEDSMPPPPRWFASYKSVGQEAKWMTITQELLNKLFSDIYETTGDKEAGVEGDGDGSGEKVVISKLAEATTRACAQLEDRCMECRLRKRADIIKHFISMFDLKFYDCLSPMCTGDTPNRLSAKQLLQIVDCMEGYFNVRKKALGGMTLSEQENKWYGLLRDARYQMIGRYVSFMGPKLQTLTQKVLNNLLSKRSDALLRINNRLGTSSPGDLFSLFSEHLEVAKKGGSHNLQRRLLSEVMAKIVHFSRELLLDLSDWMQREKNDVDYPVALINDMGTMLDNLEQTEAYFADALRSETAAAEKQLSLKQAGKGGAAGGAASPAPSSSSSSSSSSSAPLDPWEEREEQEARENLAAIEQDIPRTKSELLKAAIQMTGLLADLMFHDYSEDLSALFTSKWAAGANVERMLTITSEYFEEQKVFLDPFFFERLVRIVCAELVEKYIQRLVIPEVLAKNKQANYSGGFSRSFKLTEDRLKKVATDVLSITTFFNTYLSREDAALIVLPLENVKEMLTADYDVLMSTFELALRNNPKVSTQVYLTFERCIGVREDLSKDDKKSLLRDSARLLLDYGTPPEETDDDMLFACE